MKASDYPVGVKNHTRAVSCCLNFVVFCSPEMLVLKIIPVHWLRLVFFGEGLCDYPAGIKNNTRALVETCVLW